MEKEFTTKQGNKVTMIIKKTTLKEKLSFIAGVGIIAGLVWWFSR